MTETQPTPLPMPTFEVVTDTPETQLAARDFAEAEAAMATPTPEDDAPPANDGSPSRNPRASWNLSMDHVTQGTQHYDPRARKALRDLFMLATRPGFEVFVDEVAEAIGHDRTFVLYKLLRGGYAKEGRSPTSKTVEAIEAWVASRTKEIDRLMTRRDLGRIHFVETPTSKRIWQACETACDYQTVFTIQGTSHIGKTHALREYCRRNNHGASRYVECESASGVQGLCKLFCEACRISDKGAFDTLKSRVFDSLRGANAFVVVDELAKLFTTYQKGSRMRALEFLRDVRDKCRVPMVWCVTEVFQEEVQRGELSKFLKQFDRRAPLPMVLPDTPPVGDARAFFEAYGLDFPRAAKRETWKALTAKHDEPALHAAHDILHYHGIERFELTLVAARRRAMRDSETFGWKHFAAAHDAFTALSRKAST